MIELSPSRTDALDKISEFEQLLRNFSITDTDTETCTETQRERERETPLNASVSSIYTPYGHENIDQICAMSYNFGVTLSELGINM